MITLQSTGLEKLDKDKRSRDNAWLSLEKRNRIDFAGGQESGMGIGEIRWGRTGGKRDD